MKVLLDQARHVVELWVPNGTPEEMVRAGIRQYADGYRVVVYRSGTRNLTTITQSLFTANL